MNRAMIFVKIFYQNDWFLGDSTPSKTRLLQSYVVLWIHVIDAICSQNLLLFL